MKIEEKTSKVNIPSNNKIKTAWVRTIISEIPLNRLSHFLHTMKKNGGIEKGCGCGVGHHCAHDVEGIKWDSLPVEQVEHIRADLKGIRLEMKKQIKEHLGNIEKHLRLRE